MRGIRTVLVLVAVTACTAPATAQVYLDADFNDKTVDAPIGVGGAVVGEPDHVDYIQAVVRATPMATPSLELVDNDDYYAGAVWFGFLGSAEVTSGRLSVTCNLWFTEYESYEVYVREANWAACNFANVYFFDDGYVAAEDGNGFVPAVASSYPIGRPMPLELRFDLDAGTYDLYLDGGLVLVDRAYGVTGCGIGSISFGVANDENLEGTYSIDDILVQGFVFKSGFELGTTAAWSAVVGAS